MELTAGTRVGVYEILSPLGKGGMGEVYLGRDARLDRRVALKFLPTALSRDPLAIALFRSEALALAALNHPNIAVIHDLEELGDGVTALVMEFVEGETLHARLERGPLAVPEALQICAQIAEALEVAHERGIVHRDVKPRNVMIGPRGLVKVLDFGLAGRTSPVEGHTPFPAEAAVDDLIMGTPGYMSPEQVRARATDTRSDVFTLGVVLYECLSGQRPFAAETVRETMRATVTAPVNVTRLPQVVPPRIRDLVARCLEKAPEARPASMRAVRIELQDALGIRRAAALREGTVSATPNNLSAETSSFIGREAVLSECTRLMAHHRLVTLLGIGGSGKTRVAQRLAEAALARHTDGVWFVDLSAVTDDAHVPDVAADVPGVEDEPGRSPLEALIRHVGDRDMLFVIDNCEHVLEGARALIQKLLAECSRSRVLATSREALGLPGETVFAVPTLELPPTDADDVESLMNVDSVHLFVERARAIQPDFVLETRDVPDVVEICRRLDGIPLALELAAGRVRMLGVAQIRERLANRFKLLARPANSGSARQQTLLAMVEWSWDHLLPPEQDLMRRLGVFAGGWTLERATAVVSDHGDEFEVLDLLTRLVERSLVVVERHPSAPTRYRFLESVHDFVLERLRTHEEFPRLRERHLEAYVKLAQVAEEAMTGARLMQQIAELKQEEENILLALAWCDHAPQGAARGLVLAERLQRFWVTLGRYTLVRRVLVEAIARDADHPPSAARARVLTRIAGIDVTLGDYESARAHLEESLAFWRASGDSSGLPAALGGLGVVAMSQLRFEDALRLGEECLEIYRQQGRARGVAMALHNLGTIEFVLARPDHGRAHFEQALAIFREAGDARTEALCLSALATACLRCGDAEAARRAIRECYRQLAMLEAPREGIFALESLAELLWADGRRLDAARFVGAAETARVAFKLPLMAAERADLEKLVAQLRRESGEDVEHAMAGGRVLTLATAVAEGRRSAASLGDFRVSPS